MQELRHKIDSLKQELQANEATRSEAADALKDSEQAISEANRVFNDLNRQQLDSQADLDRVNADIQRVRNDLDTNRRRLVKLIQARYRNGEHEALRLMLNRQDPNQLTRDLRYYRYIAEAQQKLSTTLQTELERLDKLSAAIQQKHDELLRIATEKKAQRDKLRAEQAKKQQVLSKLADQIGEQRKQIGKLQRDEQSLTRLVERLNRIIKEREAREARDRQRQERAQKLAEAKQAKQDRKNGKRGGTDTGKTQENGNLTEADKVEPTVRKNDALPDASAEGKHFADLRGELHLPVRGEVVGKFGTAKAEGTTWKGVFIRTGSGQPVKAVASGRVVFADWLRGFGNMMIVDHGGGYLSLYGAAEALLKRVGEPVKAGEDIATSGNSGGSAETGIYFELRYLGKPVDPLAWAK